MIEFFMGFIVGVISVSLAKISGWISQKNYEFFTRLEPNDFDYNGSTGDISLQELIEADLKREGTK
tara:strand:+ start:600 stop:797 length:198 start_codon:yes stop_codon:yes gene_type:complete